MKQRINYLLAELQKELEWQTGGAVQIQVACRQMAAAEVKGLSELHGVEYNDPTPEWPYRWSNITICDAEIMLKSRKFEVKEWAE